MVTPTDDEGIQTLNHTQKIPISLIKAKDKASKLFQPIPQHSQGSSGPTTAKGDSQHTSNYYFASYGG